MRILIAVLVLCTFISAEEQKKKRELPKTGVLATTVLTEGVEIPPVWGEDGSGEKPPLGANVIKKDLGRWEASLVNQSDTDTFYALISVEFKTKTGSSLGSHRFAFTLKPGEKVSRAVPGPQNADLSVVNLESWKNITEKAKKKESTKEDSNKEKAEE